MISFSTVTKVQWNPIEKSLQATRHGKPTKQCDVREWTPNINLALWFLPCVNTDFYNQSPEVENITWS